MKARAKQPRWTASEDETLRQAWNAGGLKDAKKWLLHRSGDSLNKRAQFLGLSRYEVQSAPCFIDDDKVPLPTMTLTESLECIRFRKWARNVETNPRFGVAMIGGGL